MSAPDLEARAMIAWLQENGASNGVVHLQATALVFEGRHYVRVTDQATGAVTVYRVTSQTRLRRMRRPPDEVLP